MGPHRRAHNDGELLAEITSGNHSVEHFESVDRAVPGLTVDTTDGYCPDLDTVARCVVPPN